MLRSRNITFSLMVRNDVSTTSPNNYVGADDTTTPVLHSSEDTSQFDLPINERNLHSLEIVSYQIIKNESTDSVRPEYISIENTDLRSPHMQVSSSGAVLDNIWASLNSQDTFHRSYERLTHIVSVRKDMLVRNVRVRFWEADQTAFNLVSALASNKQYHALLTIKVKYAQ